MVIGSGKERRVKTGESGKREIGRRRERDRDIEREREVSAVHLVQKLGKFKVKVE